MKNFFEVKKTDAHTKARLGEIATPHGLVHTPAFLPIGTRGSVKAVTVEEVKFWGGEMVLANTYHLWQRPGDLLIRKAGGLHKFMGWDGPIFTDSGGFQVFSLGEKRNPNLQINPNAANIRSIRMPFVDSDYNSPGGVKVSEAGVEFRDELGGDKHSLTPESSIQIQLNLGSDIALVLDDVPGLPATEDRIEKSLDLTIKWAQRAQREHNKLVADSVNPGQKLYGIVQGGDSERLRKKSAEALRNSNFAGYAIGGLAVGESAETMYRVLDFTVPHLEENKPRHLLGVGTPEQIIKAVSLGCDTFDCVLPTRNARHGQLFVNKKNPNLRINPNAPNIGSIRMELVDSNYTFYDTINIMNAQYAEDFTPPDNTCGCYLCTKHTRAYLRHLFQSRDPLAIRLATMHNLRFYLDLMARVRRAIEFDSF